jgi:hypothetical protein
MYMIIILFSTNHKIKHKIVLISDVHEKLKKKIQQTLLIHKTQRIEKHEDTEHIECKLS